ncbi:MAG: histidinol-phosphatase, partial [Acidobacteria bacterium]
MDNKQVAKIFYDIAGLLELKEENPFKIRAYQNAARSLEGLNENLQQLVASKQLQAVPGIGKAIAEKIEELLNTGTLKYYEELKASFPSTLFELLRVPNLGPKKIKALHDKLGIASLKELESACQENKLVDLKGFGKVTQDKILDGIKIATASLGSHLLGKILPIACEILEYLRKSKAIERVEIAGSTRRFKEIVNDLDFIASTKKPREVADYFLKLPFASGIIAKGETKVSVRLASPPLNVDLRIVKPSEFATALHHFTGSKEHNVAMRGFAKRKGYKINEYGIFKEGSEKPVKIESEEELYAFFGMDYIPPEMRENYGEVEAALEHRIPRLLEASEIRGLFHVHSVWSDGHDTLEDMIRGAYERGYKFVGISEHSKIAT